jgi:uncharacterized membrane protein
MKHAHTFVENYAGAGAFGLDRTSDEETVIVYLQKFSDDTLIKHLVKKMSDSELEEIYLLISRLMKTHLTKPEYEQMFLKE